MTEHQGVFRNASLAVYGACGFREIIGLCEELRARNKITL
jgi:hypothetical protein